MKNEGAVLVDILSSLHLEAGAGGDLHHSSLLAEQPEGEGEGEGDEVEGDQDHPLDQEGGQADEGAAGDDVEVDDEAQPGVVLSLHRVGGEAEEEGDGKQQQHRRHQELHEELVILLEELLGGREGLHEELLGDREGLLGKQSVVV